MSGVHLSRLIGVEGAILRGGMVAVSLGAWSLVSIDGAYRLEAEARSVDSFWSTQRPLDLRLIIGSGRCVWRGVDLEIGETGVRGTLAGRPEEL